MVNLESQILNLREHRSSQHTTSITSALFAPSRPLRYIDNFELKRGLEHAEQVRHQAFDKHQCDQGNQW